MVVLPHNLLRGGAHGKLSSVPQLCHSGLYFSSAGNALIPEIMLILEQSLQIVVFNKAN